MGKLRCQGLRCYRQLHRLQFFKFHIISLIYFSTTKKRKEGRKDVRKKGRRERGREGGRKERRMEEKKSFWG
jgi:hypothetical protein